MTTERVPCRTEGCTNTILPATAKANDGHCMPCVQKRLHAEREEYIRLNRREVDPYAGVTDVVEILRVLHTPRPHDPLVVFRPCPQSVEELYSRLSAEQANRLMAMAADALRADNEDFAQEIAKSLAVFTDLPLDPMLESWLEQNCFWPPVVFRGAGAVVRDAVVAALESGEANANEALSALAWIGDDRVQELFRHWEANPPNWRSKLFVGPSGYANVAGWELGRPARRNLFHDECWAITPALSEQSPDQSLRLLSATNQDCPWCQRPLIHLIDLNLEDARFDFLEIVGRKLPILTCDVCTGYGSGFMFARVASDGNALLTAGGKRPDWLPEKADSLKPSPWAGVPVRLSLRRAIHAVDWCMPVSISQVGGMPSWVQDTAFPSCPDCSRTMKFVAQIDNGHFSGHEGVYYAFLCASCRTTATTYQQT